MTDLVTEPSNSTGCSDLHLMYNAGSQNILVTCSGGSVGYSVKSYAIKNGVVLVIEADHSVVVR